MIPNCVVGKFLEIDKYTLDTASDFVDQVQFLLEEHRTDSKVVLTKSILDNGKKVLD